MSKHVIIYSHGFGVRKEDRGLFTDIAAALPEADHVMFDYNTVDEATNTLTVAPLDVQASQLNDKVAEAKAKYPGAIIDLIAHSQGCVVAALAKPAGIRKAIFTAAPTQVLDTENMIREVCLARGIPFSKTYTIHLPRKDGTTTIIPSSYWIAAAQLDAQELYSEFAKQANLTIITATEDEVLGGVVFGRLSPNIAVIPMAAGHNFEGSGRAELISAIWGIVSAKERIVIVNEQDEIIGHKERGTLTKEDIYRVTGLWVTNSKGDILLAQRRFTKKHDPGKWGPAVAGTIGEGETYESNIVKEAKEEIGLKDIEPAKGPKHRMTGEHSYFCQWFTLAIDKPVKEFVVQEDEVEQVKWFTRTELEKELREHPEKYLASLGWVVEVLL